LLYYTGKTVYEGSCGALDPQGEARASLLSLINQATTKALGVGQAPPLPLLRLRGGRGVVNRYLDNGPVKKSKRRCLRMNAIDAEQVSTTRCPWKYAPFIPPYFEGALRARPLIFDLKKPEAPSSSQNLKIREQSRFNS